MISGSPRTGWTLAPESGRARVRQRSRSAARKAPPPRAGRRRSRRGTSRSRCPPRRNRRRPRPCGRRTPPPSGPRSSVTPSQMQTYIRQPFVQVRLCSHPSRDEARHSARTTVGPCRWTSTAASATRRAPPSPSPRPIPAPGTDDRFVVQEHHARSAALGRAAGARRRAGVVGGAEGPAHRAGHGAAGRAHRGPPDRVPGVLRGDPGGRVRRRPHDDLGHRHLRDGEVEPARGHRPAARAAGRRAATSSSAPRDNWILRALRPGARPRPAPPRHPPDGAPPPARSPAATSWWLQVSFGGRRVIVRVDGGPGPDHRRRGRRDRGADAARARPVPRRHPGAAGRRARRAATCGSATCCTSTAATSPELPFRERRALLEDLPLAGPHWRLAPVFPGGGPEVRRGRAPSRACARRRREGRRRALRAGRAQHRPGWPPTPREPARRPRRAAVGRAKLTNPRKVLYPLTGTTKSDVLAHYLAVADVMLPHLRDRPVTMVRWPDGVEKPSFFEKDVSRHAPVVDPHRTGRHPRRPLGERRLPVHRERRGPGLGGEPGRAGAARAAVAGRAARRAAQPRPRGLRPGPRRGHHGGRLRPGGRAAGRTPRRATASPAARAPAAARACSSTCRSR